MYKVGDEVLIRAKVLEVNPANLTYDCEIGIGGRRYGYEIPAECIVFTDKTYSDGLTDAWELAKKIYHAPCEGGLEQKEIEEIFDCKFESVTYKYTAEEALSKIEAYEKEKSVCVGDVVECNGFKGVVLHIFHSGSLNIVYENGIIDTLASVQECKKTGKHINIEGLLKQIGE